MELYLASCRTYCNQWFYIWLTVQLSPVTLESVKCITQSAVNIFGPICRQMNIVQFNIARIALEWEQSSRTNVSYSCLAQVACSNLLQFISLAYFRKTVKETNLWLLSLTGTVHRLAQFRHERYCRLTSPKYHLITALSRTLYKIYYYRIMTNNLSKNSSFRYVSILTWKPRQPHTIRKQANKREAVNRRMYCDYSCMWQASNGIETKFCSRWLPCTIVDHTDRPIYRSLVWRLYYGHRAL